MESKPGDWLYLDAAKREALQSPDTSRKTGCVIVVRNGEIYGHNSFPSGVQITPERLERPHKYVFTEHAERNAIYWAARKGVPLYDSIMYLPWFPCADCARAIVQSGIRELVSYEPEWDEPRYSFRDARTILEEGGVSMRFVLEN